MQALGLTPEDFAAEDAALGLWPENVLPLNVFASLGTQWRVGMAGPIGLDYNVLPTVFRLHGIPRAEWPGLFEDMRHMEAEALKTLSAP